MPKIGRSGRKLNIARMCRTLRILTKLNAPVPGSAEHRVLFVRSRNNLMHRTAALCESDPANDGIALQALRLVLDVHDPGLGAYDQREYERTAFTPRTSPMIASTRKIGTAGHTGRTYAMNDAMYPAAFSLRVGGISITSSHKRHSLRTTTEGSADLGG